MIDRLWWFATGLLAGGVVTVRALRRKPTPADLRVAAAHTGADLLDLAAKVVRPSRAGGMSEYGLEAPEAEAIGRAAGGGGMARRVRQLFP